MMERHFQHDIGRRLLAVAWLLALPLAANALTFTAVLQDGDPPPSVSNDRSTDEYLLTPGNDPVLGQGKSSVFFAANSNGAAERYTLGVFDDLQSQTMAVADRVLASHTGMTDPGFGGGLVLPWEAVSNAMVQLDIGSESLEPGDADAESDNFPAGYSVGMMPVLSTAVLCLGALGWRLFPGKRHKMRW